MAVAVGKYSVSGIIEETSSVQDAEPTYL